MYISMSSETPGSVRVPTADDKAWRFDAIQRAADFYGCNRADAVAFASGDVPRLVDSIQSVLERDDLTDRQRREIAEQLSTRTARFDVPELEIDVETRD